MGTGEEVIERLHYQRMVQWMVVAAIFLFLGKMVWDNWSQVRDASFTFDLFRLFLSTLIFAFSYFIQIWAWYLITLRLKIALTPSETLRTWLISQLGKYLPGKIWLFLSRLHFYESKEHSRKVVAVAIYLEVVLMIVGAGFIFLAVPVFHRDIGLMGGRGWFVPLFLLGLALLHPRLLQTVLNPILMKWKREPISLSISYFQILCILLVCVLSWIVGGIGFTLFIASVYPMDSAHLFFLTGALAGSSTLGVIAIFAPSGLGVREGALVYLLSVVMTTPVAVIISVLTRIWMTLIEIGLIGVIYLFRHFQGRQ